MSIAEKVMTMNSMKKTVLDIIKQFANCDFELFLWLLIKIPSWSQ